MTHAAGGEAHEHLARPWPLKLDVLDDERVGELLENGGADLHAQTLKRSDPYSEGSATIGALHGRMPRRRPAALTVRFHEGEPGVARITV